MLTFRNSKIIYYGPHGCDNCGAVIVKMGIEFGGTAFNAPDGYPYPNTEWHPHVCDPGAVAKLRANAEKAGLEPGYISVQPPMETNHASVSADGSMQLSGGFFAPSTERPYAKTNVIGDQPPQRGVR
jgi:hypothetical protein